MKITFIYKIKFSLIKFSKTIQTWDRIQIVNNVGIKLYKCQHVSLYLELGFRPYQGLPHLPREWITGLDSTKQVNLSNWRPGINTIKLFLL